MPKPAACRRVLVVIRRVAIIPAVESGISDGRSPVRDQTGFRPIHILHG